MPALQLDARTFDELVRLAALTGESVEDLAAKCLSYGLRMADVRHRVDNFASLTPEQRDQLADDAGELACGAQLLVLDAEDGGYDWGVNGPPGNKR